MTTEAVPRQWAIPDPVLSDVPPSTEVTLTPLSCNGHEKAAYEMTRNINFHEATLPKEKDNEIIEHHLLKTK